MLIFFPLAGQRDRIRQIFFKLCEAIERRRGSILRGPCATPETERQMNRPVQREPPMDRFGFYASTNQFLKILICLMHFSLWEIFTY